MVETRLLSKEEYLASCAHPMRDVTANSGPVIDIWSYVDLLYPVQIGIRAIGDVEFVARSPDGLWDHVILTTDRKNVNVVLVVSRAENRVIGHHLLDLNIEYGLSTEH